MHKFKPVEFHALCCEVQTVFSKQDYCTTHLGNEKLTGIVLAMPPPPPSLSLYALALKQSCQPKTSAIEANRRLHQSQHSN